MLLFSSPLIGPVLWPESWNWMLFIFVSAVSRVCRPAETEIKIAPKNVEPTTFHHFFRTRLSLICLLTPHRQRPKVSEGLTGRWWMDVKGVILDKQSSGPHAATSWKICLLQQQLREMVCSSLTSSPGALYVEHTYFVIPWKWKITRLHHCISDTLRLSWQQYWRLISNTRHKERTLSPAQGQCFLTNGGAANSPASHMLIQPSKFDCLCPLISDATLPRSFKSVQINSLKQTAS